MFRNYSTIIQNQYEAAFSTINRCLLECTDDQWSQPIANLTFSQASFHALFYADVYLNPTFDDGTFEQQEFHQQHKDVFRDYEEFQDRPQQYHYERPFVESYLQHCRRKMRSELGDVQESWLLEPSPFPWIESTRSEVHVYNIRHVQHHAAQMILSLRLRGMEQFPWFRSGWKDD